MNTTEPFKAPHERLSEDDIEASLRFADGVIAAARHVVDRPRHVTRPRPANLRLTAEQTL